MAARLDPKHDAKVRQKIQTSQLINRLNAFALGENDPQTDKPVQIDSTRLKAMEILLRKSLPDLSSIEVSGDPEHPLITEIRQTIVRPER